MESFENYLGSDNVRESDILLEYTGHFEQGMTWLKQDLAKPLFNRFYDFNSLIFYIEFFLSFFRELWFFL